MVHSRPTIETIAYLVSQREKEFMTRYGQFCSCMHDLRNTRPEIQVSSRQIFNLVEQGAAELSRVMRARALYGR